VIEANIVVNQATAAVLDRSRGRRLGKINELMIVIESQDASGGSVALVKRATGKLGGPFQFRGWLFAGCWNDTPSAEAMSLASRGRLNVDHLPSCLDLVDVEIVLPAPVPRNYTHWSRP
jgi:hypothetical protein